MKKIIEDFPMYEITSDGRVWSNYRNIYLSPKYDKDGYATVCLRKNNKNYSRRVHRLVAETFIPNPNNYPIVNHKDENVKNNNVENLEWCSVSYNTKYGNGIQKMLDSRGDKLKGKNNYGAIPIVQLDLNYSFIKKWDCAADASRELGISRGGIRRCCNGIRKTAGGYIWKDLKNYKLEE